MKATHLKHKHILSSLVILMSLFYSTHSFVKCNQALLNEFGLTGLTHSISDRMYVCGHVHDKCCSIYDEIRIHKYWNEYTKPIIDMRVHDYMLYTRKIIESFRDLMDMDPQLMILKHVVRKQVPYSHEVCAKRMEEESAEAEKEFHLYSDAEATLRYSKMFYADKANEGKKFDLTKHTHSHGDRHYDKYPTSAYNNHIKKFGKTGTSNALLGKIEHEKLDCHFIKDEYTKDFIIINEAKSKFCLGLYQRFIELDNNFLLRFLPAIKNFLSQMVDLKGSVYCALCDAHQQTYFNIEKRVVTVKQEFCSSLLEEKKDLINFMHIFLVEYMDNVMQYTQCFETDSQVYNFPFRNFLEKYKRRIPLIKECYASLDKPDFMDKCWFICNNYKFFGLDSFFNGDVELVKRVYLIIFSFIHKLKASEEQLEEEKKSPDYVVDDNVNGLLVEPLHPGHAISNYYYIEDSTRKELLGKLDTRYIPPKLSPKKKEAVTKKADELLKNVGLPDTKGIAKLKEDHKKLEAKVKELENPIKLNKDKRLGDLLKKFDSEGKKEKEIIKEDEFVGKLAGIMKKHKLHEGHYPARELLRDRVLVNDIKKALSDYGLSKHIIDQKFEDSRIETRYLKTVTENTAEAKKKCEKNKENNTTNTTDATDTTNNGSEPDKACLDDDPNATKQTEQKSTSTQPTVAPSHTTVEAASEVFEKSKNAFGATKFKAVFEAEGLNPLKDFALIDYKFNITEIIHMKLKPDENIGPAVLKSYFESSAKFINKFNFNFESLILDAKTITNHTYNRLKTEEYVAKIEGNYPLLHGIRMKIKKIVARMHKSRKRETTIKEAEKRKKEEKKKRAEEKFSRTVETNHHVDKEHFHENFTGFKDYFLKVFGP